MPNTGTPILWDWVLIPESESSFETGRPLFAFGLLHEGPVPVKEEEDGAEAFCCVAVFPAHCSVSTLWTPEGPPWLPAHFPTQHTPARPLSPLPYVLPFRGRRLKNLMGVVQT